jgi:hypothetical protein
MTTQGRRQRLGRFTPDIGHKGMASQRKASAANTGAVSLERTTRGGHGTGSRFPTDRRKAVAPQCAPVVGPSAMIGPTPLHLQISALQQREREIEHPRPRPQITAPPMRQTAGSLLDRQLMSQPAALFWLEVPFEHLSV